MNGESKRGILIAISLAFAGAVASPAAFAGGTCFNAAASVSAASAAYVAAVTSDPDSTAGIVGCTYPLMTARDFEAAITDAASKAPDQQLAMFIIRLGTQLLTDNAAIVPDVVHDAMPDGLASNS